MNRKYLSSIALLAALSLAGCASSVKTPVAAQAPSEKILSASGYARFDDSGNVKQRWLNAQQMSKLNAFRGLADQLYNEPLDGGKTVGSQVVSNEAHRVYLDNYLREAKASDYRTVQDSLKTTLTLTLTPRFYQCMGGGSRQVEHCLREEGKLNLSRIGFKPAQTTTINLACGNRDCSDQYFVDGFSKSKSAFNHGLLKAGIYDSEWLLNTGARTLFNALLIEGMLNAL